MDFSIWIGFDPREASAFAVARSSCKWHLNLPIQVRGLVLNDLRRRGLYRRPMERRNNLMWDLISDAPQSTEHANSRFLVPVISGGGWAVFADGDMLFRSNIGPMLTTLDPKYALYCVKHDYSPIDTTKMDGQIQTRYSRKNWSSFMIFNCDHPANRRLTIDRINTAPGRDLHRFDWLEEDEIGSLPVNWNWLVGHSPPDIVPDVVHFTEGTPDMAGYENVPYADEWIAARDRWAS